MKDFSDELNTLKPCEKCGSKEIELESFCHPHSGMGYAFLQCSKCGNKPETAWAKDENGPTNIRELVIEEAIRRWNKSGEPSESYKRLAFEPPQTEVGKI